MKSCDVKLKEDLKKEISELRRMNEELQHEKVQFEISMVNVFFSSYTEKG